MSYEKSLSLTAEKITRQLLIGIPILMSTHLTKNGHVILIKGIKRDENNKIILYANNPRGKYDFEKQSYGENYSNGENVLYPLNKLYIQNNNIKDWEFTEGVVLN